MAKKVTIRIPTSEGVNAFDLRRKRGRFGPVEMDQWWMPIPSVYPTNGRPGENYRAIVDLWWSDCRRIGSDSDQSIRETWLLSRLLPLTRSKGSSRIVADAAMHGPGREGVTELESLLHGDAGAMCDELTFRNQIFGLIGPETDTDQERQRYKDAVEELLGPAGRSLLTESPAQAEAHLVERWQEWTRRYGRRAGQEEWKTLMDIFSYEGRAALHQCYSQVWTRLMPQIAAQSDSIEQTVFFHEFWHCQQRRKANDTDEHDFHLFAGHVFGLHPAGATFIRTEAGRKLIGDYLQNPDPNTTWPRLLAGLLIAVYQYAGRRKAVADDRAKRAMRVGGSTEWLEEIQEERARGNLRREFPGDNARPRRKKAR